MLTAIRAFPNVTAQTLEESLTLLGDRLDDKNGLTGRTAVALIRCNIKKEEGNELFKKERYEMAIEKYQDAMRVLLGSEAVLPSQGYTNEKYMDLCKGESGWHCALDLAACSSNISQCYWKLGRALEVRTTKNILSPNRRYLTRHLSGLRMVREVELVYISIRLM